MFRKLISGAALAALMAGTASADNLREALVSAYQTNPTLTAQRETLQATDATVAIARAAGRPQVTAQVGLNRNLAQSGVLNTGGKGPTLSVGADLSVPIFNGGSADNSVNAAKTRVEAGRATLRAVEGDVFTQAVSAYMNVIRDRAVVELNQNNVKVLETNLEATSDRFQIGDLTRTDVAQSESRLEHDRTQHARPRLCSRPASDVHPAGRQCSRYSRTSASASGLPQVRTKRCGRAGQQSRPHRDRAPGYRSRVRRHVVGASRLPKLAGGAHKTY